MSVEKKIAVTFALDPSFEKVKNAVTQLVSEVTKLGEAFNRVNQGFSNVGAGGGFKLDGKTAGVGSGSTAGFAPAVHRAAASVGGGVADNLTRSVQNMSQVFKVASEQGTGAMRLMSDTLRRNVEESDRNIEKLSRSLEKLSQHYQRLNDMKGKGALVDNALVEAQGRYQERASQLQQEKSRREQLMQNEFEQASYSEAPEYADIRMRKSFGQRLKGFFGGESDVGGIRGGVNDLAKRGLAYLGIGAAGGVLGVMAAGYGGWQVGQGTIANNQQANLALQLEQPMWRSQRQAAFGQIYGGNAMSINQGDYARGLMLHKITQEEDYKKIVGDDYAHKMRAMASIKSPVGAIEAMATGNAWKSFKDWSIGGVANAIGTSGIENGMTVNEIERQKAINSLTTKQAEQAQRYLEEAIQRNPMLMSLVNKVGNGALGNLSLARAAGMSGDMVKLKQGGYADSLKLMEGRANDAGYDVGEWVGMMQQIAGTAGRGLMHRRTSEMLSLQHGGLQNAVQLYSLGSQYITGDHADRSGQAMINAVQSITGRRGLDPLAASQITGAASNLIMDPRFASENPEDFIKVVGRASATGQIGMDLRTSRDVIGGLGVYNNILGGQIDPLQQALNASAAIGAAPSANYYAHQGLMGLDTASIVSGLRGGENGMPSWMKTRGISYGMLKDYSKNMMSTMFSRLVGPEAAGTEMGQAAGRFMEAGGLGYMKDMNGADRNDEMRKLAEGLAATMGISRGDAFGLIRVLGSQEGVMGDLEASGTGQSATMKSIHGVGARTKGDFARDEAERLGRDETDIRTALYSALPAQRAEELMRKATQQVGRRDTTDGALEDVQAALQNFVNVLKREVTDAGRIGITKAKGSPK